MEDIAIYTDSHGLLEPVEAVINDCHKKGINKIYSLGDNIGVGPNPSEVLDLIRSNNVISIAGNSEEYILLGSAPFRSYFNEQKEHSRVLTDSKLNDEQREYIKLFPHSIDLVIGGKKIALVHFANDVRCDFMEHSTWSYQDSMKYYGNGYEQFLYTNSSSQKREIDRAISMYGVENSYALGYVSAKNDPLFSGKKIDCYDAIFQGHVHFKMDEHTSEFDIHTLKGVMVPTTKLNLASYIVLHPLDNGFNIEDVEVEYDRNHMEHSINNNSCEKGLIKRFVRMI